MGIKKVAGFLLCFSLIVGTSAFAEAQGKSSRCEVVVGPEKFIFTFSSVKYCSLDDEVDLNCVPGGRVTVSKAGKVIKGLIGTVTSLHPLMQAGFTVELKKIFSTDDEVSRSVLSLGKGVLGYDKSRFIDFYSVFSNGISKEKYKTGFYDYKLNSLVYTANDVKCDPLIF